MKRKKKVVRGKGSKKRKTASKSKAKSIGLFGPPKDKNLAEIVRIDTPDNAKMAAYKLTELYKKAKTRRRKRHILRAVVLAANRAKVIANNPRISPKERREARQVAKIYRELYDTLKRLQGE